MESTREDNHRVKSIKIYEEDDASLCLNCDDFAFGMIELGRTKLHLCDDCLMFLYLKLRIFHRDDEIDLGEDETDEGSE